MILLGSYQRRWITMPPEVVRLRFPSRAGLTLLELILAMGMMSMLALSMYMSLRIGFNARESALNAVGPMRAANIAIELIRQDIESAVRPNGILAGEFFGESVIDGTLSADTLTFYSLGSDQDDAEPTRVGGIQQVELAVVTLEDTGQRALVRRTTSNLLASTTIEPQEEILCRGVRNFIVRYYDGYAWQEYWDSTALGDVLPMAVEITLELGWPAHERDATHPYRTTRIFIPACQSDLTAQEVSL